MVHTQRRPRSVRTRILAVLGAAVLVAGMPLVAVGASNEVPSAEPTVPPTAHIHPDGSVHDHAAAAPERRPVSPDELRRFGLKDGTGACDGLFEAISAPQHGKKACSHGPDRVDDFQPADTAAGEAALAALAGPTPPGIPCATAGPWIEVFYLYGSTPSAATIAFRKAMIKEAVALADQIFVRSSAQLGAVRHPRWKMTGSCTLEITATNITTPSGLASDPFEVMDNLLSRGLLHPDDKALVFSEDNGGCSGVAMVYPNDSPSTTLNENNFGSMLGRVWGPCFQSMTQMLVAGEVAAHELTHMLGAVQESAPRSTSFGHCYDESDVMCYDDGSGIPMQSVCPLVRPELLDCGKNDYFHTSPAAGSYLATHWNVAKNKFLTTSHPAITEALARPSVSMVAPGSGQNVSGWMSMNASATAPSGTTISKVEFSVNGQFVGQDTTSPYSYLVDTRPENGGWPNGTQLKIVATAYDSYGRGRDTAVRTAWANNPTVRLTAPSDYAVQSGSVTWAASATARGGKTVTKVDVFLEGVLAQTDTTAPYGGSIALGSAFPGEQLRITARVTDSGGATRWAGGRQFDGRYLVVGAPTVEYLGPAPFSAMYDTGPVTLAAHAVPVPGTTIASVAFRVDGALVGTDASAPYSVSWTPSIGEHSVTIQVTDSTGGKASAESGFTVQDGSGTVALTAPSSGATISGSAVSLSSTPTAPAGMLVDGVDYYLDGSWMGTATSATSFGTSIDVSGLRDGSHLITAVASFSTEDFTGSASATSPGTLVNVDNPDPSVAVTAPAAGASVRGSTVPVTASASNLPADGFSLGFLLNGYILGFDDAAPWATTLDTSWFADGAVALRAEVQGWDGRTTTSAPRTVNIANTTGWVSTPAQNATVKGSIQFWVSAFTDRTNQIEVVRFYVDGKAVASDRIPGYGYTWNTKTVANGSHVLTARITTMDGRGFTTAPRTVTVSN